jgi:hypothetical protein
VTLQLHSAQIGSEWAALCRGCCTAREKKPVSYVGGLVGLDFLQKRYISRFCRQANHDWPKGALEGDHTVTCRD